MNLKLTATAVKNTKSPGLHNDGRGLYLKVTPQGTKSWIFRFRDRGTSKLRDMGLGSVADVSLKEARDSAGAARKLLQANLDPIAEREKERAALRADQAVPTFDQCCEKYIDTQVAPFSANPKHVQQWRNTLATYASPIMGHLPVDAVEDGHVLAVLEDIWTEKTETASRLRGRIENILDWAAAPSRKYRSGPNPARWKGHLEHELQKASKIKTVKHHPALPFVGMYGFMQALAKQSGVAARCLEFTILTAVRTSEAIGARWSEFDLEGKVWTIPAARLKVKKNRDGSERVHRVPLSDAAIAVLQAQKGQHETFVFPGTRKGKHLSNMAMLKLLRDMGQEGITVHGFRSSFRDWCAERTNFPPQIAEFSLAHINGDKAEAAYFRSDVLEKRRALMGQWATYCATKPGKVVPMKSKAAK